MDNDSYTSVIHNFVTVNLDGSTVEVKQQPLLASHNHIDAITKYVDGIAGSLRRLSLEIHDHPELRYKEVHAHDILAQYMESQSGWTVKRSAYDIATAFIAVYDSGRKGPVVSFNAEYGKSRCASQLRSRLCLLCGCSQRYRPCLRA